MMLPRRGNKSFQLQLVDIVLLPDNISNQFITCIYKTCK